MKTTNYAMILALGLVAMPALAQEHGKGKMKELDLNQWQLPEREHIIG